MLTKKLHLKQIQISLLIDINIFIVTSFHRTFRKSNAIYFGKNVLNSSIMEKSIIESGI